MKIVFFEVQDWEREEIEKNFPEATLTSDKLSEENVDQYQDFEIISSFIYSNLSKNVLEKLTHLKFIATRSTGFDHIDINFAKDKNIIVSNVPEYGSRTVAEHTFALILALIKKIYPSVSSFKSLKVNREEIRSIDLFGKTLGVVGLGKIGKEVVKIACGFGLKILAYNRSYDEQFAKEYNVQYVDLPTILKNSDIITLHLAYNKDTHHLINKNNIHLIKKGAYLINTARGGLIETESLLIALKEGILSGIGLDVVENEKELNEEIDVLTNYPNNINLKTLVIDHILINHPQVIITPHNAFNSIEALQKITQTTIKNIKNFLQGKIINSVS